jgi:uncharacterized membrane protein YkvA (DUF1232 family)
MATKKKSATPGSDAPRTEDFYTRLRQRLERWADEKKLNPKYREYILALPDLLHLVSRLVLDQRVDMTSKAMLGMAIAYAMSPFDLLPDILFPLGFVDDLLVVAVVLDLVLERVPRAIVAQHWAGSGDVFELIRGVLAKADEWVGRGLYRRIRDMVDRQWNRRGEATAQEDVVDGEIVKKKPRAKAKAAARAPKKKPAAAARRSPKRKS